MTKGDFAVMDEYDTFWLFRNYDSYPEGVEPVLGYLTQAINESVRLQDEAQITASFLVALGVLEELDDYPSETKRYADEFKLRLSKFWKRRSGTTGFMPSFENRPSGETYRYAIWCGQLPSECSRIVYDAGGKEVADNLKWAEQMRERFKAGIVKPGPLAYVGPVEGPEGV